MIFITFIIGTQVVVIDRRLGMVVVETIVLDNEIGHASSRKFEVGDHGGHYMFEWRILASKCLSFTTLLFVDSYLWYPLDCYPKMKRSCSIIKEFHLSEGSTVQIRIFEALANISRCEPDNLLTYTSP